MKRGSVEITLAAAGDLQEIWAYLSSDSAEAAERLFAQFESTFLRIGRTPGMGHWREDLADRRHKFILVSSYFVVYFHETNPLQVIRVLHAARDVQSLLDCPPDED